MRQTHAIDGRTFAPAQTGPWRLELGAEVRAEGVFFRVWAAKCQRVEVVVEDDTEHPFPLASETGGYFSGLVSHLTAGALYWYRLGGIISPLSAVTTSQIVIKPIGAPPSITIDRTREGCANSRYTTPAIGSPNFILMAYASMRRRTSMIKDRYIIVNLGCDLEYVPAPEPLLAPVKDGWWRVQWSSDDPRYGGPGIMKPYGPEGWYIPSASAIFLGGGTSGHISRGLDTDGDVCRQPSQS
jgi:hypothetical protein